MTESSISIFPYITLTPHALSPRRVDPEHRKAPIHVAPNCAHTPAAILHDVHEAPHNIFSRALGVNRLSSFECEPSATHRDNLLAKAHQMHFDGGFVRH